jgi:gluconokinase
MVIILMGVAGSGKTTVGQLLARRLGWIFYDGDDFHPASNREKMKRGVPLDETDRRPWLLAIRQLIIDLLNANRNAVVACSALKRSYRQLLAGDGAEVKFVYLQGSPAEIAERLSNRRGHFFDPALLQSQFADLEEPDGALKVDISLRPEQIVDTIIAALAPPEA